MLVYVRFSDLEQSGVCVDRDLSQSEGPDRSIRRPTYNRDEVRFQGADKIELPLSVPGR